MLDVLRSGAPAKVVGEAANIHQRGFVDAPRPTVYLPYAQYPGPVASLVVRISIDPKAMVGAVASQIQGIDPTATSSNVTTMPEVLSSPIASQRLASVVFTTFAGVALLPATLGVVAFTPYPVALRSREIGIRVAFGATPRAIYRLLLSRSGAPVLIGIGIGSGSSVALGGHFEASSLVWSGPTRLLLPPARWVFF